MRVNLAAWCSGLLVVHLLPSLPSGALRCGLLIAAIGCISRRTRWIGYLLGGFLWAAWRVDIALAARLPEPLAGRTFLIVGALMDSPRAAQHSIRFGLDEVSVIAPRVWPSDNATIKLTWYHPPDRVAAGMRCQLYVRLKPPHGLRNVGGFDAERWNFSNGVDAVGYVIAHPHNQCAIARDLWLARLRYDIAGAIDRTVGDPGTSSILSALAVGVRAEISDAQWQLLRATGVVHLISVSGLHIGMVAMLVYALARSLAGAIALKYPNAAIFGVAALAAIASATAYALLTGFSLPTQRTLIMIAIGLWNSSHQRAVLSTDSVLVAATLLLSADPSAGLSLSFWLSFGSLVLLLYLGTVRPRRASWRQWLSGHWTLALLIAPITGFVFQTMSVTSPVANAVAIPIVTLIIVPALLIGIVAHFAAPSFGDGCWLFASLCWQGLAKFLAALAAVVAPLELPLLPTPAMFMCGLAAMLLVFVPVRAFRFLLAPSLLAVCLLPPQRPLRTGELRLDVLDVGQGLSVVVTTAKHTLLYDTGARYPAGADMGADVVVPFLRAMGKTSIDELVISHGDNDHAGGAPAVIAALKVHQVTAPDGQLTAIPTTACVAGRAWAWDGVRFEILHPTDRRASDNDRSCVIQIHAAAGAVLLTGDIEATAEHALLQHRARLRSDVLLVPHHGSATSSSAQFLNAVAPRYALVSAGYRNRFGHPAESVRAKYRAREIEFISTVEFGAITLTIGATLGAPHGERMEHRRYWDP